MSGLLGKIRSAVDDDRLLVSWHGDDQCEQRRVTPWQLIAGLADAKLIRERPASRPHPSVVVKQTLADGSEVHVVWAWLAESRRAKLVTVFFTD